MAADSRIVLISPRTLTHSVPGYGVYHLPRWRASKTPCGRNHNDLVLIRRDSAENIAQLCRQCEDWAYREDTDA